MFSQDEDVEPRQILAKKRHLDPVLETNPTNLLVEYKDPDELLRLYDRIIDLEEEIVAKMEFDEGVKSIEGAKIDGQALWILVRWESDRKSFVPAQVIRKIAPNKLLQYYESRVAFSPQASKQGTNIGASTIIQQAAAERKAYEDKGDFLSSKPPPAPEQKPKPNLTPVPIMKSYSTITCKGCKILLQYPKNTNMIRCPKCQTSMSTKK